MDDAGLSAGWNDDPRDHIRLGRDGYAVPHLWVVQCVCHAIHLQRLGIQYGMELLDWMDGCFPSRVDGFDNGHPVRQLFILFMSIPSPRIELTS